MRTVYAHANTWNSCLEVVRSMGFRLSVDPDGKLWIAESGQACLKASNPAELLGLAQLDKFTSRDKTGESWWGADDGLLRELLPVLRHEPAAESAAPGPVARARPGRSASPPARQRRPKQRSTS